MLEASLLSCRGTSERKAHDWNVQGCVMVVVARDGIEPPTPAFSGPRSTTELSGLGTGALAGLPRAPVRWDICVTYFRRGLLLG